MKKLIAIAMILVMLLGISALAQAEGKILYLSNLNSGAQYEFYVAYLNMMAQELGYTVEIVYGDSFNDPAGNLKNVKNAYTSDVVGLISCMDGGLINIMEEYPDMWVVGFFSDYDNVFNPGGTSEGILTSAAWRWARRMPRRSLTADISAFPPASSRYMPIPSTRSLTRLSVTTSKSITRPPLRRSSW